MIASTKERYPMSFAKIEAFLSIIEDVTELEEVAEDLFPVTDQSSYDEIFEPQSPYTVRGVLSGDEVAYVVRECCDEDENGETTVYHVIYCDGYVEYNLTPESVNEQYTVDVITTVRIFPLK